MQLEPDGTRLVIAFPMASVTPKDKRDNPGSAISVVATGGRHLLGAGDAPALSVIASPPAIR